MKIVSLIRDNSWDRLALVELTQQEIKWITGDPNIGGKIVPGATFLVANVWDIVAGHISSQESLKNVGKSLRHLADLCEAHIPQLSNPGGILPSVDKEKLQDG